MTIEEVEQYYKSSYNFRRLTGMSNSNIRNWRVSGYIPIISQLKIEKWTGGILKADLTLRDDDERA